MTLPAVWPFAMTSYNWEPFILLMKEVKGESPTRVLDTKGVPLHDLSAFSEIVGNDTFQHFGFLFKVQLNGLWRIMENTQLSFHVLHTDHESGTALGIIDGNISLWRDTIKSKINSESQIVRDFYSLINKTFKGTSLKRSFE